jgi:mRNA interferase MazF
LAGFAPGQIVIVDWRDALPREPNKLRPAIVVEDGDLFGPSYPNIILVPISEDRESAPAGLSLAIDPTPENGCTKPSYALSAYVATTSKRRIRETQSRISPDQLKTIRRQITLAIGLDLDGGGTA